MVLLLLKLVVMLVVGVVLVVVLVVVVFFGRSVHGTQYMLNLLCLWYQIESWCPPLPNRAPAFIKPATTPPIMVSRFFESSCIYAVFKVKRSTELIVQLLWLLHCEA